MFVNVLHVGLAMSVLQGIWAPMSNPAGTANKRRGWKQQVEMETLLAARERSPRQRRFGAKANLKAWARGETTAVGMWRICHAIVEEDGTDAGIGMGRLAHLASVTSGSENKCAGKLRDLLAETYLPTLISEVPHEKQRKDDNTSHSPDGDHPADTQPEPPRIRHDLRYTQSHPRNKLDILICQRGWTRI